MELLSATIIYFHFHVIVQTSELGVTEHVEGDPCKFALWVGRTPTSDNKIVLKVIVIFFQSIAHFLILSPWLSLALSLCFSHVCCAWWHGYDVEAWDVCLALCSELASLFFTFSTLSHFVWCVRQLFGLFLTLFCWCALWRLLCKRFSLWILTNPGGITCLRQLVWLRSEPPTAYCRRFSFFFLTHYEQSMVLSTFLQRVILWNKAFAAVRSKGFTKNCLTFERLYAEMFQSWQSMLL